MKRLLGFVGWIGVLLVAAAAGVRFLRPEYPRVAQGLALAGLVTTAVYALSQWRDVARSFQGRNVKYGSVAASSVAVLLAILVGLNWISSRENKRWDLTAASQFSLSDQTKKILADLKKPVVIKVFYAGPTTQEYRDHLNEYSYLSKQVSVQYVDAERNPTEAQAAGVTAVPTFAIAYDGRTEKATSDDEQAITNALKKVIEGKAKKIYFLQGHGERDPNGSDKNGYSGITEALKNDNFEVDKLTLAQAGKVPDDATAIVIAGPTSDLLPAETDLLRAYLKKGGKLLILVDPPDKGTAPDVKNVIALAKEWGIDVGNDMIIDASGLGQLIGGGPETPIAMPAQPPHPIVADFRVMTAFPIARSVTPIEGGTSGHVAQKVLETSPQSWAETDLKGLFATGRPTKDESKGDKPGPVGLAAAVSAPATDTPTGAAADAPKPETRVVVVGDSDFASNAALGVSGNREIYLNMANWLAQQEDFIAIRPKNPQDRPISMTADQGTMIFIFTMAVVPLLMFAVGISVWWRKR